MVDSQRKGKRWEREAAKILNEKFPNTWKRIPGSGAIGTTLNIPVLKPDLVGKYGFLPFVIYGEAKVGYGKQQMAVKKEWFDKIRSSAEESYALPVVILKFDGARQGVRHVVAMDFDTWNSILMEIQELYEIVASYEDV